MGKKGDKPVESLTAKDFIVLSDGQPQTIRMIPLDSEPLPVHAVFVLQTDGSSQPALAKIKKTGSLVSMYIANDMGTGIPSLTAVVTVTDEVRVVQAFSANPDWLQNTFDKISAGGGAARLIDGVNAACDLLAQRKESARQVIVLIGESRDSESKAHFQDVVVKAQKEDAVIYTISYSPIAIAFTQKASDIPPPPDEPGLYDPNVREGINLLAIPMALAQLAKLNVADAFAQATGGSHEKFNTLHGLEARLTAIGNEIHNRYVLTFVPPELQPPGYHQLSVRVRETGDWRIHARSGYWSDSE
jgi:VWFA-related protein